jgi:carbamoyltransferase
MHILGFSGGPNAVHEQTFGIHPGSMHDAAAVLLRDGEVIAAIEQERLDRLKHSNKAPLDAIRFCLEAGGIGLGDLDHLAFYGNREYWDRLLAAHFMNNFEQPTLYDARTLLRRLLERELGGALGPGQPSFVSHHLAHAISAVSFSGFDESLVLVVDGQGDDLSGLVLEARGTALRVLRRLPIAKSLGYFYLDVVRYLGFRIFDEYKVMGLAPYGDPGRFRHLFQSFYSLEADGDYTIALDTERLFAACMPRREAEPIGAVHQDLAAALQEALETIVLHLLRHFRQATGLANLCLAGGVAHNCTLNGKLLYSGLFDQVFVQPASHDAGCALGAALWLHHGGGDCGDAGDAGDGDGAAVAAGRGRPRPLDHVYWGSELGTPAEIERRLERWRPLVEIEQVADPAGAAAELIAAGQVLGWAQGRSEFGPRALGNRSIVADPRPPENKDLINAMVKKREAFRPFAPSVVEERAGEFFELPPGGERLPFMVFTVRVRPERRAELGAVTHVDGSARIQTVSRAANQRFWRLLHAVGERTGVPIVLNTSFNNHAEPIVDSVDDALVCYLTTRLDTLVVGDYLVRRRRLDWQAHLALVPSLPRFVELRRARRFTPEGGWADVYECGRNTAPRAWPLSPGLFELLARADGRRGLDELAAAATTAGNDAEALVGELLDLWSNRLVRLLPRGAAAPELAAGAVAAAAAAGAAAPPGAGRGQ